MRAMGENNGGRGGALRSIILFIGLLGLLAAGALGVGGYFAWREAKKPGPLGADAVVLLKPGSSVSAIATELAAAGAIRNETLFVAAVRVKGAQAALKAGEYKIPARASVLDVIGLLVEGKSILHYFTAPEGRTSAQVLRGLGEDETLLGDLTLMPAEGELLPETYAYTRGETRDGMIRLMMKAQDDLIERLWNERATDLPYTTREEAIILASIVEKETGVPDERPRIAAVFVNRLNINMRLQTDPTVIYGLGTNFDGDLTKAHLRADTPYNTYTRAGLPPTPIALPGLGALQAVLKPASGPWLYFVARGDGTHFFSSTLTEHNRAVAQYQK